MRQEQRPLAVIRLLTFSPAAPTKAPHRRFISPATKHSAHGPKSPAWQWLRNFPVDRCRPSGHGCSQFRRQQVDGAPRRLPHQVGTAKLQQNRCGFAGGGKRTCDGRISPRVRPFLRCPSGRDQKSIADAKDHCRLLLRHASSHPTALRPKQAARKRTRRYRHAIGSAPPPLL